MSVLIEALTLVVPKSELGARFPGGAAAFVEAALELPQPPRFTCDADEHLVGLSFYDPDHLAPCVALLQAHSFVDVADDAFVHMAYVDQHLGPTAACEWLDWAHHDDGFTCAWLAAAEPGALAADEGWTPERSRGLVRRAELEPGRIMRLSDEDGLETWLDLATGRQLVGLARGAEPAAVPTVDSARFLGDAALEPAVARPLDGEEGAPAAGDAGASQERALHIRARVVEVLEAAGLHFGSHGPLWIEVPIAGDNVRVAVRVGPAENGNLVRLYTVTDMRVPEEHRTAACEVLTRANYGLPVGNFEMDLSDGEVAFKGSIFLAEDGELGTEQLASAIRGGVYLYDRYFPAFMRVIYGGITPEEAIAEVER